MDNGNFAPTQAHTAWVRAYRADGWQVSFTFVLDADDPVGSANTQIAALAANGYTPNAPGLESGEKVEEIAYVARRIKQNNDGTESAIIDLYPDALNFRFLSVYLDNAEDVSAFERASGIRVNEIALYDGSAPIERGKNARHDTQYIKRLPHIAKVVWKDNPRYEEGGQKPKRLFVRWQEAPAPNVTPFPPQTNASAEFDAAFPPNPTPHWTKDKVFTDAIFKKANASFSMSDYQALEALNVKAITLYTGTKDEAFAAIKAYAERRLQDAS